MGRLITVNDQYQDDAGNLLTGGLLYFYETNTLNAKTTYSDSDQTTANANPVVLDAFGRCGDIFFDGPARVRVHTSAGVLIDDLDPVYTDSGAVASGTNSPWSTWSGDVTYGAGDLVIGSNDSWYQSVVGDNTNNSVTNTTYWTQLGPIYIWNTADTYKENDFAYFSGLIYRSKVDSNQGNTPVSSKTQWEALGLQHRHEAIGTIAASGSKALDLTLYNSFDATLSGNATITFQNEPLTTEKYNFDMLLDCSALTGAQKPSFPASVRWTRGFEPNWVGVCGVSFVKYPGSSIYYGAEFIIDATAS